MAFVQTEESQHNELRLLMQFLEEGQDRLKRVLDSLCEQVGQIFVVVEKQVESLLGRNLEMFRYTNSQ